MPGVGLDEARRHPLVAWSAMRCTQKMRATMPMVGDVPTPLPFAAENTEDSPTPAKETSTGTSSRWLGS